VTIGNLGSSFRLLAVVMVPARVKKGPGAVGGE
jgi:hypothetical protein